MFSCSKILSIKEIEKEKIEALQICNIVKYAQQLVDKGFPWTEVKILVEKEFKITATKWVKNCISVKQDEYIKNEKEKDFTSNINTIEYKLSDKDKDYLTKLHSAYEVQKYILNKYKHCIDDINPKDVIDWWYIEMLKSKYFKSI